MATLADLYAQSPESRDELLKQILAQLQGRKLEDVIQGSVGNEYFDGSQMVSGQTPTYSSADLNQFFGGDVSLQPRYELANPGYEGQIDSEGNAIKPQYTDRVSGYEFAGPDSTDPYGGGHAGRWQGTIGNDGAATADWENASTNETLMDRLGPLMASGLIGYGAAAGLAGLGGAAGAGSTAGTAGTAAAGLGEAEAAWAALEAGGAGTAGGAAGLAGLAKTGGGMDWGSLLSNPQTWLTGAQVVSGVMGSNAARDAADTQADSADAAIAEQRRQYDLTRSDFAPWRETGAQGLSKLSALLGMDGGSGDLLKEYTGESLTSDPGYQFGLTQGEQGINRGARARGLFGSGAAMKDLLRFNQDYAGTKFNEGFNRDATSKGNKFNWLSGVSGAGQTATGQVASAGTNTSNNVSNLQTGAGNSRAAGIVGGTNAINNTIGNIANNWQQQNTLDQLLRLYGK